MQFTDIKTKTKVIALALQELINKNKVAELKFYKGKVNTLIRLESVIHILIIALCFKSGLTCRTLYS